MKKEYAVVLLGVYMLAMGAIGFIRTGSLTPVSITGSIAVITIALGCLIRHGSRSLMIFTAIWLTLNVLMNTYMTIGQVVAHAESRAGSGWIFGSMALFSLVALIILLPELRRRHLPPGP